MSAAVIALHLSMEHERQEREARARRQREEEEARLRHRREEEFSRRLRAARNQP